MRHSSQITYDAFTFHVLANGNLERPIRRIFQHITQENSLAFFVRHLNANVICARNRSKDADTRRSKSKRYIVSQVRNTVNSNTRRKINLEQGNGRPVDPANNISTYAEVGKRFLKQHTSGTKRSLALLGDWSFLGSIKQAHFREVKTFQRLWCSNI